MTAYPRGTGLGSPRNDMPGLKPYRWRGKLTPPDPEPRRKANSPGNRRERQAALAGMRVNTQPGHPRLRDGEVTCERAAGRRQSQNRDAGPGKSPGHPGGVMITAVLTTAVVTAVTTAVILEVLGWSANGGTPALSSTSPSTRRSEDMPVPYRLATDTEIRVTRRFLAAFCTPCRDAAGDCACTVPCGHPECYGGFSADDVDCLHGLTTPRGRPIATSSPTGDRLVRQHGHHRTLGHRMLADTVIGKRNPRDGDVAEVSLLISAVERDPASIDRRPCECPELSGETCGRSRALRPVARKADAVMTGPGVYDIGEAEYFADPALSCSGAKLLLPPSCPALFRYLQDHPEAADRKDVFDFGSAAHKMVLGAGPELAVVGFGDLADESRQGQERDAARAEGEHAAAGRRLRQGQGHGRGDPRAPDRRAAARPGDRRPAGAVPVLVRRGDRRTAALPHRLAARPRPGPDRPRATTKRCSSADPDAIAKAAANYGYYMQADWYCDGIRALGLDDDPAFLFVFQEKDPPYLITVAELDDEARRAGRARNRQAIERFRDCTEAGIWPGYADDIEYISLPPWAARTLGVTA